MYVFTTNFGCKNIYRRVLYVNNYLLLYKYQNSFSILHTNSPPRRRQQCRYHSGEQLKQLKLGSIIVNFVFFSKIIFTDLIFLLLHHFKFVVTGNESKIVILFWRNRIQFFIYLLNLFDELLALYIYIRMSRMYACI